MLIFFPIWTNVYSQREDNNLSPFSDLENSHLKTFKVSSRYFRNFQDKIFGESTFLLPNNFIKNHGQFLKEIGQENRDFLETVKSKSNVNLKETTHSYLGIKENWKNKLKIAHYKEEDDYIFIDSYDTIDRQETFDTDLVGYLTEIFTFQINNTNSSTLLNYPLKNSNLSTINFLNFPYIIYNLNLNNFF